MFACKCALAATFTAIRNSDRFAPTKLPQNVVQIADPDLGDFVGDGV